MDLQSLPLIPLVVIGSLVVGFVIKNTDLLEDNYNRFIPLILAVLGALLAWWIDGVATPETIIYGAVSGLASTGLHQSFKAFIEGGNGNDVQ